MASYRLGVDVGGTFTDAVLIGAGNGTGNGSIRRAKVLSTSDDQSVGVIEVIRRFGVPLEDIELFCHGHTVAINAILQRKGPLVGLMCTEGTRDLLDMARLKRPLGEGLYDATWIRPHQLRPLVHRRYIREVSERLLSDGNVHVALDEAATRQEIAFLRDEGVQAIAVCLLNSYLNMAHEERVIELIHEVFPEAYVQSSAVRPVVGEYDRTLAVVLNAYAGPVITQYLSKLRTKLEESSFRSDVMIMQMNGGVRTLARSIDHIPAYTIESGPVAGMLGAECYARKFLKAKNLVCIDIGGTSTDIGLLVEGEAPRTEDWEAEFGIRLGYPAVDVRSVGAGGGSLIQVDKLGTLHVGPESAGAKPGPACYGLGGTQATITDAFVALGIVQPDLFLGGQMQLDRGRALAAIAQVAERLEMDSESLAEGALQLTNANIENEISRMAFDRALDLRQYSLLAYGGAGPLHAASIARNLGIKEVIVPYFPGGFAALGMVAAPLKVEAARSVVEPIDAIGVNRLAQLFEELETTVVNDLIGQAVKPAEIVLERAIRGMYSGQSFDNRIVVEQWPVSPEGIERWKADFHHFYERVYGYAAREIPIVATTLSVVGSGPAGQIPLAKIPAGNGQPAADALLTRGRVFVGGTHKEGVPFYKRQRLLAGDRIDGPAVIDDELATVLVVPDSTAEVDDYGNIIIRLN